jgi:hypothetical protein
MMENPEPEKPQGRPEGFPDIFARKLILAGFLEAPLQ